MKKIILVLVVLTVVFTSCSKTEPKNASDKHHIAVSILPLKDFVENIGGDYVDVSVAIPKGASPANYEPKPDEIKNIMSSEIYFSIGVPTEKGNILPKVQDSDIDIIYLDHLVDEKYEPRMFEGDDSGHSIDKALGHSHSGRDPHIWVSPKRAMYMVEIIKDKLSEIDKEHKDYYEKNANDYIAKIKEQDDKLKESFNDEKFAFIVFHPSLGYFADDYGLEMIAIEEKGKKANANHLKQVIDIGREKNITRVLYQQEFYNQSAKQIASELGGNAVAYTVLWENYVEGLENIRNTLMQK